MATSLVLPKTKIEQQLAKIWQEVLHIDEVGIYDNFFELGGSSVLLNQLQLKIAQQFSRDLNVVTFFQYSAIHTLAKYLDPDTASIQEPSNGNSQAKRGRRKNTVTRLREQRKSHRK